MNIWVKYIFWKRGPLLFDLAHIVPVHFRESMLPCLLAREETTTRFMELDT